MSNRITMLLQNTPGLEGLFTSAANKPYPMNVIAKYSRTRIEGLFTSANKPYPMNIKTRHSILETYKDNRPTYIKKTYDAFGLENLD